MEKAKVTVEEGAIISQIDKRLYGSFIEHLGRAVYHGIYEPAHKLADEQGFRKDVLKMVSELNVPIVRYPGGNFVSGYRWEDGIGEPALRPRRLDLAWQTLETNQVGLNEFCDWARKANTKVMMAVNLGTRGISEAVDILEYCNRAKGSYWSDLRNAHGYEKPHNIKTWCLGNEMDGDWQIGHKTAYEYGRLANETGKAMKLLDSDIELVACGSSSKHMDTYGDWEETVLRESYDTVDYLSLHQYYDNKANNSQDFLSKGVEMDAFIKEVVSICDSVQAKLKKKKKINLSFDEWNVWYHSEEADKMLSKWTQSPHRLEDIYNFEDAVLIGSMLITLINNSNRVKMACLAQLVNVLAPIMTVDNAGVWRQTIYYPFAHAAKFGHGKALRTEIQSPKYSSESFCDVNAIDCAVVQNENGELTIFSVNRQIGANIQVEFDFRSFKASTVIEEILYWHPDLKAVNGSDESSNIVPHNVTTAQLEKGIARTMIPGGAWHVLRVK
ncbi:alpha-N-arabinofuranosidase [Lachnospiraceae bacterium ZAX-1]